MEKSKSKTYLKILLILIVLLMLPLFSVMNHDLFNSVLKGDTETIIESLNKDKLYAYLLTFILMVIQNTFTIIPLILVITLNYTLFGFINGFIWGWVCSIIAAIIIFICVRYIFQERLIKKFKQELTENIEKNGFLYVFQGRIFPFVPTSLINILAGISTIRFRDFLLGTILGNFLYFFVLTLIPAGLFSLEMKVSGTIIVMILLLFFVYGVFKKYRRKHTIFNSSDDLDQ